MWNDGNTNTPWRWKGYIPSKNARLLVILMSTTISILLWSYNITNHNWQITNFEDDFRTGWQNFCLKKPFCTLFCGIEWWYLFYPMLWGSWELKAVMVARSLSFDPRPDDTKYVVRPSAGTLATNKTCKIQKRKLSGFGDAEEKYCAKLQ